MEVAPHDESIGRTEGASFAVRACQVNPRSGAFPGDTPGRLQARSRPCSHTRGQAQRTLPGDSTWTERAIGRGSPSGSRKRSGHGRKIPRPGRAVKRTLLPVGARRVRRVQRGSARSSRSCRLLRVLGNDARLVPRSPTIGTTGSNRRRKPGRMLAKVWATRSRHRVSVTLIAAPALAPAPTMMLSRVGLMSEDSERSARRSRRWRRRIRAASTTSRPRHRP